MGEIRRYFTPGRWVFLTLVCAKRAPRLRSDISKLRVLNLLDQLRSEHGFELYAWVLLDDHLHLLVSDPQGTTPLWIQRLKLRFVRGDPAGRQKVWQKRYWDHLIRDEIDLHRHLDYIHHNPVKHGLVVRSADYRWSSFLSFVRRGRYAVDWQAVVEDGAFGD